MQRAMRIFSGEKQQLLSSVKEYSLMQLYLREAVSLQESVK